MFALIKHPGKHEKSGAANDEEEGFTGGPAGGSRRRGRRRLLSGLLAASQLSRAGPALCRRADSALPNCRDQLRIERDRPDDALGYEEQGAGIGVDVSLLAQSACSSTITFPSTLAFLSAR